MTNDPIFTSNLKIKDIFSNKLYTEVGFRFGDKDAHTSRTMMFEEMKLLLRECSQEATRSDYDNAIIEDNCLQKKTLSTRKLTRQRLNELYSLKPSVLLFRVLRHFWYVDEEGQSLLALKTWMKTL